MDDSILLAIILVWIGFIVVIIALVIRQIYLWIKFILNYFVGSTKPVANRGLTKKTKTDKIKQLAKKLLQKDSPLLTANDVWLQRKQCIFKISTGSEEFDKLLSGGVESMAITEAFGESRCGKTQISHTLCITCQLPKGHYPGGKALFMDTEHTFRPERLKQMAARFDLDENSALNNVYYLRINTSEHLLELMDSVAALFHSSGGQIKLLIIDSFMAFFRFFEAGRVKISERQQKMAQLLSKIQNISNEYNVAVFITNPNKPIGSHISAHTSTVCLALGKDRNETRSAKIYGGPYLSENEAIFAITEGGIADVNE